jgi:hypothetical protein
MEGETTVIHSTYPPAYPLDGKWTLYPYYPQACAEARSLIRRNAPLLC